MEVLCPKYVDQTYEQFTILIILKHWFKKTLLTKVKTYLIFSYLISYV